MKNWQPLVSICMLSVMLMAALAMSPGIADFISEYGVSETVANLSITLPYLISIPFTLLAGRLTASFSKKVLSLAGTLIICFTGILPYFLRDFTAILIVRALMGVGLGLLFTIVPSLAPDYYPAGSTRSLAVGMQSAWAGSGGFVFNILSGHLVNIQTKNIYLVYSICILFFLLILILLPWRPPVKVKTASSFEHGSLKTAFLTFLFISAGMTLSLNVAVYIIDIGIGNSVQAGYTTSAYSVASFIVGCTYVFVSYIVKRHAILVACLLSAFGMLICVAFGNIAGTYAGAALVGAGLSIFMPSCISRLIHTVKSSSISMSIGFMMVGCSAGQTFSCYLINPISNLFTYSIQARFIISAIIFITVAVIDKVVIKDTSRSAHSFSL